MSYINKSNQGELSFKFYWLVRSIIWLFLAASVFMLAYTYYRAEIIFGGSEEEKYFKYYLLSLIGIFIWGGVLRLKDELKINILMMTISLLVGLYLVEITLAFVFPVVNEKASAAEKAGVRFDERTKLQVIQGMRDKGVDAKPSVKPYFFIKTNGVEGIESLYPFGGVSKKITVNCNESGTRMIYASDRYGFNNPDFEWNSPQTKWVLTGDSYTQGACVNPGEEIAGQIRSITGNSLINLGSGGNGPLIELAVLKEYAESRRPEIVLWIYSESNDLTGDLQNEKSSPLLMSYLRPGFTQNLIQRQTEIDSRLEKYIAEEEVKERKNTEAKALGWNTEIFRLFNLRKRFKFDVVASTDVDVDPLFKEILKKARDRVKAWGGMLYFVYLPEYSRYSTSVSNHDLYRKRSEVIGVAEGLAIPVIDIHKEIFAKHQDQLSLFPFRMSGHYTAEAYSEVARAIVSRVKKGS